MSKETKRKNLGMGLGALLGDSASISSDYDTSEAKTAKGGPVILPIASLTPSPFQPRQVFDESAIDDLASSIRECGILQPLLVRPAAGMNEIYEIIAGERRWRAAQRAQLHEVPVVIRDMDDKEVLEVALVENLQRQDLNPLEEAEGYQRLQEEFNHTQEDLARVVGKSRSHVANSMRLLASPTSIKAFVEKGELSAGHARALLGVDNAEALAEEVIAKGLNVRQTEALAKKWSEDQAKPKKSYKKVKDADCIALEKDLSERLGLAVSIDSKGDAGRVMISYKSLEQLDDLLVRLGQ
jgi:ParB family chromosome partitioning protein